MLSNPFVGYLFCPLGHHLQLAVSNSESQTLLAASLTWLPVTECHHLASTHEGILLGDHLLAYRTEPSLNLLAMLLFLPRQHILDCLGEWCVLWGSFGLTKYIHSSIFTSHSLFIPPIVSPRSSGISTLLRVGN